MIVNDNYIVTNVSINDEISLKKFERFYNELFLNEFSSPNICESFGHYIDVLKKSPNSTHGNKLFITLFDSDEDIIGGIIYVYLSSVNSGVIEYLVINPKYRHNGFGKLLYSYAKEKLNIVAIDNKIDFIFGETSKHETSHDFNSYEMFFIKQGFRKLDFKYIQPPLSKSSKEDRNYMLIVDSFKEVKSIDKELLKKIVAEYFHFSFSIDNPIINEQYKEIFKNISSNQINIEF